MVEALTLQKSGNSTPRCSKTVSPVFQLVWTTSRRSQVSSSYGWTPSVLKIRLISTPVAPFVVPFAAPLTVSVMPSLPCSLCPAAWLFLRVLLVLLVSGVARCAQLPHYAHRASSGSARRCGLRW